MRKFGVRDRLAELLDAVAGGEDITITRRGKPVARLVRHDAGQDRGRAVAAARRIIERRKGIALGDDVTIRELIDESRR